MNTKITINLDYGDDYSYFEYNNNIYCTVISIKITVITISSATVTVYSLVITISAALLSLAVSANREIQRFSGWIQLAQKTLSRFHLRALGCPSKAFVMRCVSTKYILYSNCIEAFKNLWIFVFKFITLSWNLQNRVSSNNINHTSNFIFWKWQSSFSFSFVVSSTSVPYGGTNIGIPSRARVQYLTWGRRLNRLSQGLTIELQPYYLIWKSILRALLKVIDCVQYCSRRKFFI